MKFIHIIKKASATTLILLALSHCASGQVVDVKGVGDAKTQDAKGIQLPAGQAAKQAISNAAVYAIDEVLQQQSDNLRQQFQERVVSDNGRREEVLKMISNIKVETVPDSMQNLVRATIAGRIDMNELKDYLNKKDKIQSVIKRTNLEMAVFFTVRRSTQVARGASVEVDTKLEAANSDTASEQATEDGLKVVEESSKNEKNTTSVDAIEKADKVSWESDAQLKEPFGTGLIGQFTDKGFKNVIDGSFFEISDQIDKDITSRGQPSPQTLKSMVSEVRTEGSIELIVIGNLDFSIPTVDPVSGMKMVEATMTGKVMRAKGSAIPRIVAALEPKSFKAVGATQEVAKKRVLEAIAPLTADEIISKLRNNGVLE